MLHFHGSRPQRLLAPGDLLFKTVNRLLLRLVDAVLVLSTEEQRQWRAFAPRMPVFVVSNPFVPEAGGTLPWEQDEDEAHHEPVEGVPDPPQLLFVGRLLREKGIYDLLDAMARVLRLRPCTLIVAGDGPEVARARAYAAAAGLGARVQFRGYLRAADLAAAYATATMLVLPTYWIEGFPLVFAEAMHAGLPIVTTRIRGAADHLQEHVHALFVPPRDPEALARAIACLLEDERLRARMGAANRTKVRDFAPEIVCRRYRNVLEQIVRRERLVCM